MLDERFWTKVKIAGPSDCWEWQANKNNMGYGMFSLGAVIGKKLAHRLAYEDANGPIPRGGLVLHSCDNPACVNPAHLRVGSHKDNARDMDIRGRRVVVALKGDGHPGAALTEAAVISLLKDYVSGLPRKQIAAKYGISLNSLDDYTSGKSWAHLHGKHDCPTLDDLNEAKRKSHLTEDEVREIWRLHFSKRTVTQIAAEIGHTIDCVAGVTLGKTWRHLPDAPSIEMLKHGGVRRGFNQFSHGGDTREVHPRTKIPTSEIPSILRRLEAGETLEAVGNTYGVKKTAIWRIRNKYALLPDGSR